MESVENIHPVPNLALDVPSSKSVMRLVSGSLTEWGFGLPWPRPALLFRWLRGTATIVFHAQFPNGNDVTHRRNVLRGIALAQQQVSALAGSHDPAVIQAKVVAGTDVAAARASCGKAGAHQQFQFAVDADAVRSAGIGCIGAGKNRNMCCFQLDDRLLSIFLAEVGMKLRKRALQIRDVSPVRYGVRCGVVRERFTSGNAAYALKHRQGRNNEGVMCGYELAEVRCGSAVREKVSQAVGTRLNRNACVLLGSDVNHCDLAPLVGCIDDCLERFFVERGAMASVCAGVVDHNLDVVGSFGDAGLDLMPAPRRAKTALGSECRIQCRDLRAPSREFQRSAGRQGREYLPSACFLYLLHVSRVSEHVQFGRDTEDLGLFERVAPDVRV